MNREIGAGTVFAFIAFCLIVGVFIGHYRYTQCRKMGGGTLYCCMQVVR